MSDSSGFKTIIGLEIHAQLNTKSKMFCRCDNDAQGQKPNTLTCPICMGMPGTLPVANIEAIKKTIKTGLALGCEINRLSKFDRKHYFYPDLPKGYQISQYDQPFCLGGELSVEGETIRFNRVHLEEDAGKLLHPKGSKYSIVDLNRAGTPLMEMVTEPDINSPQIAKVFLQELQQILRSLKVSSADMEKGHMRCDANISVVKDENGKQKSSPIVELKNLNSFKFVEKALLFEEKRLRAEFDSFDGQMKKQTRRFDATTGKTLSMREKEEAKDYRYFPEPDLPPFDLTKQPFAQEIAKFKSAGSSLPSQDRSRLESAGVSKQDAQLLAKNSRFLGLTDRLDKNEDIAKISKIFINEKSVLELSDDAIIDLAKLVGEHQITSNILRQLIDIANREEKLPSEIYDSLEEGSDLAPIVKKVLDDNQETVAKYKAGKKEVIGFLIGQVMREAQGQADPNDVRQEITKIIGG